jgi:hypothetical protein
MKRTDLEKLKGAKINNRLKQDGNARFGRGGGKPADKAKLSPLVEKLLQRNKSA